MSKSNCVFKQSTKNNFIKNFLEKINTVVDNSKGEILYAGVMLVDQVCGAKIPEIKDENTPDDENTPQKYHKDYKCFLKNIFDKLMNNPEELPSRPPRPPINSILIDHLESEYKKSKFIIYNKNNESLLSIDNQDFKFSEESWKNIFKAGIDFKLISESFRMHFEAIKKINEKYNSNNHYMLFYPVTYSFIKNQTLLYLTLFGKTNDITKILEDKNGNINKCTSAIDFLISELLKNQIEHISLQLLSHSTKSAIAAIMSRNGSHNIGSHVLAAVGTKNNDLPDDQILFKYIQHRMDYIAQIATDFPNWTSPTWFVRDLMRRFYMQRHLLNYISQSEGLGAYEFQPKKGEVQKNNILIKIRKKNVTEDIISPEFEKSDFKNDVQIAIPGGIIGHQAFYTIIENIIRNAAKHEWTLLPEDNKSKNLEITIEIDDKEDRDFIIFRIWDNVSKPIDDINEKLTKSFVHQDTGKLLKSNWGLAEMKISAGFLNRSTINQIGSDNKKDISFELDDDKKGYSGIIRAIQNEDDKPFGYEFAIPRPKEVLLIGFPMSDLKTMFHKSDQDKNDESKVGDVLKKNNIYLEEELSIGKTDLDYEFVVLYDNEKNDFINKLKDYKKKSTEVRNEIETFPFRLLIVLDDPELKLDKLDKSGFLSNRIVLLGKDDIKLGNAGELPAFKLLLYKKWVRHLMKRRGILKNKKLKMLINLSGDHGHAKEDIVKLIFYRFKDSLLEQISSNEYSDAKNQLTEVTNADIDEYAKNNKESYSNANKLIDAWEDIVVTKDSRAKIPIDLKKALKAHAQIYFEILKNMYVRYDEDCQTLPKNYRGQSSTANGDLNGLCINNDVSISITHDEEANELDIAYTRHTLVEAEYYSEALSGSQIYFSLLQNLAAENDYERNKRILQLIENALLRVVIIDERVAQYYCNCSDQIRDRFVKGKFNIPTKIAYNDKTLDLVNNADKQDNFLAIDEIDSNSYDVFIIHQGVLDKIVKGFLANFIDEIKKLVPFVIITSGRGEPENIPENAKFLPFSNIESFVLSDFPEKYLLTQMAMKIITEGA